MPDAAPDYLISAARFDAAGTRLRTVRVHRGRGAVGLPMMVARLRLLQALRAGSSFATARPSRDALRGWTAREAVGIASVDGTEYVRIDSAQIAADDLGNLPSC